VLLSVSAKPGHEHPKATIMEKKAPRIQHQSTLSIVPLWIVRRKAVLSVIPCSINDLADDKTHPWAWL
jgi:hypothetical protein